MKALVVTLEMMFLLIPAMAFAGPAWSKVSLIQDVEVADTGGGLRAFVSFKSATLSTDCSSSQ